MATNILLLELVLGHFSNPQGKGFNLGYQNFLLAFILSKMIQNIVAPKGLKLKKIVALGFE